MVKVYIDKAISEWEDDGGSAARLEERRMVGTLSQIAWAVQIKSQVEAEFDRVRKVLEYAMTKQSARDVIDIKCIIQIVEDKRTEVMENQQAGYFIREWQELGKVSRIIVADPRYQAIKASQITRIGLRDAHRPDPDAKNPRELEQFCEREEKEP
jgi:hypothetical protein